MAAQRRHYTEACHRAAVRPVPDQGDGVTEAARNLERNAKRRGRWTQQAERPPGSLGGNGPMTAEPAALRQGRQEGKRLRMAGAILRPAPLFFAHAARCHTPALRRLSRVGRAWGGVTCWRLGAVGCLTPNSARRRPPAVVQRLRGWSGARRYPKSRPTVLAGGA
jgi:transposase-like protein